MGYKWSKDYKLLFDLINQGYEIIAIGTEGDFIDGYVLSFDSIHMNTGSICRTLIPKNINIHTSVEKETIHFYGIANRHNYIFVSSVNEWDGKTKEENVYMLFLEKCKKYRIEFLPI